MAQMVDVAGYIHGEMTKNATGPITAKIKSHNGSVLGVPDALVLFAAWVGNRKPWDHKAHLKAKFGEWSLDDAPFREYNFDIWSNLHYGFVGRAGDFSAWTLKNGAGYAQYKAGTSPEGYWSRRFEKFGDADVTAALDDPKDQAAIGIGIALWDSHGSAVTLDQLLKACRAAVDTLNTRPPRILGPGFRKTVPV